MLTCVLMRFTPSLLDQIRARINVSTVVGRRVQWDRRKTQAAKGDYWACCPFHTEKSPSFHADDRQGRYFCFGCKASGDIFTFLVEKDGVPFPEAVERLANEAGVSLPKVSEEDIRAEEKRASLYDVMQLAQDFFLAELQTARGAKARGYLADRDLSANIQSVFGLGYAPDDRSALRSFLAQKNITVEQMAEAGLVIAGPDIPVAYDRFRDRVMFPIRDARGRIIAFGGRALSKDVPAKYLNSPETPIFSKGSVLYNFDKARTAAHQSSRLVLVEGYVDVIAMHRAGFAETVAPLGTALTEHQLALIWKTVPEPILCFDGDAAGLKAAYRALDLAVPSLTAGHSLKFAFLPDGQDPDDLLRAEGATAISEIIAKADSMADVLWRRALDENDRSTPERKALFEKELRQTIARIGDETVRRHYLDDLKTRLDNLFRANTRQRAPIGQKRGSTPRLQPGQRAWEIPQPASQALRSAARIPAARSHERRLQMIVIATLNHPELIYEHWEDLSTLDLPGDSLDTLRSNLLDAAAAHDGLERSAMRHHLLQKGFGPELERLEQQAKRLNEWFLGPEAAIDDARTGLRQMLALHRKTVTLERDLRRAENAFALEPSEDNLGTLVALRQQLDSAIGAEAIVPGFGAASGRSIGSES
jgi:DNA primase